MSANSIGAVGTERNAPYLGEGGADILFCAWVTTLHRVGNRMVELSMMGNEERVKFITKLSVFNTNFRWDTNIFDAL